MTGRSPMGVVAGVVLALGLLAAPAPGAPPINDRPEAAAAFAPYSAANGIPLALQGLADLTEATADAGVPRCLGASSFARTAWFRLAEAQTPTLVSVEASGRTLDLFDL